MAGPPAVDDPAPLRPCRAVLLASGPEQAPPQVSDVMQEGAEGRNVRGHGMVVIPAGDHALQPSCLFGDRRVPPSPQFLLEVVQLGGHPVASRLPPKQEAAAPSAPANMREAHTILRQGRAFALSLCVRPLRSLAAPYKSLRRFRPLRRSRRTSSSLRPIASDPTLAPHRGARRMAVISRKRGSTASARTRLSLGRAHSPAVLDARGRGHDSVGSQAAFGLAGRQGRAQFHRLLACGAAPRGSALYGSATRG